MFWDTHCHLFKEYYEDIDKIIDLAKKNGVKGMIVAGCSHKSNQEVISLLNRENIYGVLGIHPEEEVCSDEELDFMENNLLNSKIVGIGEIGLDYHYNDINKENQKELFEKQLLLAQKYNMPVVIHSREATEDTIKILKKYQVKGVIHSFSGSLEVANIYIKMGFLLGVNGVITFKNCNLKEVIKEIDLNYIILETDSPYLTPVPFRGKKNDPSKIIEIAQFIAELKNVELKEVARITNGNIKRLFDI